MSTPPMPHPTPADPFPVPWPGGPRETPTPPRDADGKILEPCPFDCDEWWTPGHRCAGLTLALAEFYRAPVIHFGGAA